MALPSKKINKIQLPLASGESASDKTYDIIPTTLQDGTTTNKLSVPTLSADDIVVTTGTHQNITGIKTFKSNINVFGATGSSGEDCLLISNTQIQGYGSNLGGSTRLVFPSDTPANTTYNATLQKKTGTIALTSDLTEIVDLTSVN